MFDWDKWQELLSALRHNKLRTLLTACGVFWGVFMLVLMLGFGRGLQTGVTKNMIGFATNSIYLWGQRTSMPHKGIQPGRWVTLDNGDTEALQRDLSGVLVVAPRNQLGGWRDGNLVSRGAKVGNFGVMGDVPEFAMTQALQMDGGRFVNQLDMADARKVTVIGEQVRKVLFGDEDPIGQTVQIKGVHFQVVGTYTSTLPGDEGERANQTLHIPFATFQRTFNTRDVVGWFALVAEPNVLAADVEHQAREIIKRQHGIHPEDDRAVGSYNAGKDFLRVENLFAGIRFFIWFVSIATLCAGALGVSNIMLVSVRERTREIGVRKALGATPWAITSLVLREAMMLTLLAGYAGLVCGVLFLEGSRHLMADQGGPYGAPSIDLAVALIACGVLVVVGVVAGVVPARHAARIEPVAALRYE